MKTKSNFYFKMNESFINSMFLGDDEKSGAPMQQQTHFSPYHEVEQEVILYDGLPLKVMKIEEFQDFKGTGKNLIIIDLLNPEPYI